MGSVEGERKGEGIKERDAKWVPLGITQCGALVIANSSDEGRRGKETGKWSAQDSGVTFEWPNEYSWGPPLRSCC